MATKKTAKKKSAVKKTAVKKTATKKAAASSAPAPVKKAVKKTTKKTVKKKAPEAPASTKKVAKAESPSTPPLTTIVADIDVGWGNTIYLRGEGGPLRWDKGILMDCADGKWTWSTSEANDGLEFKFVFNDKVWAKGENMSVDAGSTAVLRPTF
ncbi:MAG: hypothetical protein ACQKBV_13400 [Puniceicoccales bacterium]